MPKEFKKDFKAGKVTAHARQRKNGTIEIRCQYKNKKITASAKTLTEAKERFIKRLKTAENGERTEKTVKFKTYAEKWLSKAKKPFIKANTYNEYKKVFNLHIYPRFGDKSVGSIKQFDLQEFLDEFIAVEKYKTAKVIYQLLKSLYEYAYADELVARSPMAKVKIAQYEQKKGSALSREDEKRLVEALKASPTDIELQAFILMLYTGVRRSELASVHIEGEWITVKTSKQRKGKSEKVRRVPVSPMLKRYLPLIEVEKAIKLTAHTLSCAFRRVMEGRHLHELRHTFITRAQECGISREIVSLWAGHAADRSTTTLVYTHLEAFERRQIDEIALFDYDF